jgi:magnesium-transporting ATPase (P-type)
VLSEAEAEGRLARRGPVRAPASSRSTASIVRANVFTLFNAILIVAGVATLALADPRDALFLGILVANTGIGIAQELRAKRELDRLAALVAPHATVVRDGRPREVPVADVLAGDLVRAGPGDQLVADGRLEPGERVVLDESNLTGESRGVTRTGGEEIRSGSFVLEGAAAYTATAVGDESYAGRIAGKARSFRHPRSPLERALNRLLTVLVLLMVPLAVILAIGLSVADGHDSEEVVSTAVAGLVSLVPEGLMLLASLTAAVGAIRMARRGALVQQLNGIESLASADVLCLDKTGTLTRAELRVDRALPAAGLSEARLGEAIGRLAAATPDRNRTMAALAEAFSADGTANVAGRVPFSSRRRWSAVDFGAESLVLGAPELFALGELASLAGQEAERGRRVVAIGSAPAGLAEPGPDDPPPDGTRVLGVVVLAEHLRDDARETVAFLRREGEELRILSGDAPATVGAIARDAGVADEVVAVDGSALPEDPAQLARVLARATVIGRISPDDKRRVVESLAAEGRYVAMVGDGVNDVPALKAARLAIAQGTGAQMAKSVADVVLVHGDFAAVPPMVREGRTILRNVQRVARLFVTKSIFAAMMILAFALLSFDYPYLPRHMSLVATLTVGVPAFFLALVPSEGAWRPERFVREIARFAVPAGVAAGLGVLAAYLLSTDLLGESTAEGRTVVVTTLTAVGLAYVIELEGGTRSRLAVSLVVVMAAAYVAVLLWEPLRDFFALTIAEPDMLACAGAGTLLALGLFVPVWGQLRDEA